MTIRNLGDQVSIANQFLLELRDIRIQKDRLRFRHNLSRLGEIMAYEISKELMYQQKEVETPLGKKIVNVLPADIVLITILRAGLPFLEGFQRIFDQADIGFIGSYRVEGKSKLRIQSDYLAAPSLAGKTVILIDTMLATGHSLADALKSLTGHGKPRYLYLASVISAPEGIRFLNGRIKQPASLWTYSVDEKLNARFYIVPGLGDAGDLSFGIK